jgi:hypothetical protein
MAIAGTRTRPGSDLEILLGGGLSAVPNGQLVLGSGSPVTFTGRFTGRRIEVRSGVTVSLE